MEPPEAGPAVQPARGRRLALPVVLRALEHRNFRLIWGGQLTRGSSHWLQLTAVPLLVLQLGGSALDLGVIAGLQYGPVLAFGPVGGVLADRLDKRQALMWLQLLVGTISIAFAALIVTETISIGNALVLSAIFGLATSMEMPIRQSFFADLVPRSQLPNAIVLQQAAFNVTRLVGPAAAGILLASVGFGATFAIAALLNLTATVLVMRIVHVRIERHRGRWFDGAARSLLDGLRYVRDAPRVRNALIVLFGATTFALGILAILPLYATRVLGLDSTGYGLLLSAFGVGGVLGAVPMSLLPARAVTNSIPIALLGTAASMLVLGISAASVAFVTAAMLGLTAIVTFGSTNVLVQVSLDDRVRGRVMGIYVATFSGGNALGGVLAGAIVQLADIRAPFIVCAIALTALAIWAALALNGAPRTHSG